MNAAAVEKQFKKLTLRLRELRCITEDVKLGYSRLYGGYQLRVVDKDGSVWYPFGPEGLRAPEMAEKLQHFISLLELVEHLQRREEPLKLAFSSSDGSFYDMQVAIDEHANNPRTGIRYTREQLDALYVLPVAWLLQSHHATYRYMKQSHKKELRKALGTIGLNPSQAELRYRITETSERTEW